MNVLIIHAHPEPLSFTTSMMTLAKDFFEAQGYKVQVSDLYAMKFNPVASAEDFNARSQHDYLVYALEQRHNFENNSLSDDIQQELEKIQWANLVIFSFPLYWGSVPAILKGWIDRVLVSGYCYGGRRIYNHGGLVGKTAVVALTLGGRDYMFADNGIHGSLNSMLKPLLQGTLGYVGFKVLPPFAGYHVPYLTHEQRTDLLTEYKQYLSALHTLSPLDFPQLEKFDKTFKPLS